MTPKKYECPKCGKIIVPRVESSINNSVIGIVENVYPIQIKDNKNDRHAWVCLECAEKALIITDHKCPKCGKRMGIYLDHTTRNLEIGNKIYLNVHGRGLHYNCCDINIATTFWHEEHTRDIDCCPYGKDCPLCNRTAKFTGSSYQIKQTNDNGCDY